MLSSLYIKDFAIIEDIEIDFSRGLNVITGETGAGKTIVVEALGSVLGSRIGPDAVRAGADKAMVTARFDASSISPRAGSLLSDAGISFDDEIIIHRVIGAQGKGKISINGVPVTGAVLKTVSEGLVDIASQHEHQVLLNEERHSEILDSFAGVTHLREAYAHAHKNAAALTAKLEKVEELGRNAAERLDFIRFQLDEIKSANLIIGEDLELELRRARMKHSVVLAEKARLAEAAIYKDTGAALETTGAALNLIRDCAKLDSSLAEVADSIERAKVELSEAAREIARYADSVEANPDELEKIEDRLHLIRGLVKKHGGSLEACIEKKQALSEELLRIENFDEELAGAKNELDLAKALRREVAVQLSSARKKFAQRLGKFVESELGELGMLKARFLVEVKGRSEEFWDESGADEVRFMIAPNVGEPSQALVKIASGGELSRVLLALKAAASKASMLAGTSVFDEVDSGIGGKTAAIVGEKLKQVSLSRQVICVTHHPQVAAFADSHLSVAKEEKSGRTVTAVVRLNEKGRVAEVARMLSASEVTSATIRHAEDMILQASAPRPTSKKNKTKEES